MSTTSTSYFYGVYLLCSKSTEKRFAGRCYIGFTVNPNRRINQHNRGKDFGGAKRTNNKGPWQMVMIIHGFPNNIAALQFEWAWQQPALSTRLKPYPELRRKGPKESYFQYNFRILSRMLNVGPWHRLPLTIRWLESEYECDFILKPPAHMEIVSGNVEIPKSQKSRQKNVDDDCASPPRAIWAPECHLCMQRITNPESSRIGCINSLCKLTCHIICLANYILSLDEINNRGHYIPISGECPLCEAKFKWIDLLQRKRKLEANGVEQIEEEDTDGDYDNDIDDCNEDDDDNDGYDSYENDVGDCEIDEHDFNAKVKRIEIESESDTPVVFNGYNSPICSDAPAKYDNAHDDSKSSMDYKKFNECTLLDAKEQKKGNLSLVKVNSIEIESDSDTPVVSNGYSSPICSDAPFKYQSAHDDSKLSMDYKKINECTLLDAKEQKKRNLSLFKPDEDIFYDSDDDDDGNDDHIEIGTDSNSTPVVYNDYSGDIYSKVAKLHSANDDRKLMMDSENGNECALSDAEEQKKEDLNLVKNGDDIIYVLSD